jgi:hypothetical protein
MYRILFLSILLLPASTFAQQHPSPYSGQQSRDIKALSDDEIRGLLNGQGMALAKAGELNHYPGPMHVLELAEQLKLSDAQKRRTEAIRKTMLDETIPLGAHPFTLWSFTEAMWAHEVPREELIKDYKEKATKTGYPDFKT